MGCLDQSGAQDFFPTSSLGTGKLRWDKKCSINFKMQKQSSEGNVFIPLGSWSLNPSRQPQLVELACKQLEEG